MILDLFQLNRDTYNRVHNWFDYLDEERKTLLNRQLEGYPSCDDLTEGSSNSKNNFFFFALTTRSQS